MCTIDKFCHALECSVLKCNGAAELLVMIGLVFVELVHIELVLVEDEFWHRIGCRGY